MSAVVQKKENGVACETLPRETIETLHRNFMEGIEKKARASVPKNAKDKEKMAAALKDLFLQSARRHITIKSSVLQELIQEGPEAIEAETAKMNKQDFFSRNMRKRIQQSADVRKDYPEVLKAFGDKDRIYLRMKASGASRTRESVALCLKEKGYNILDYNNGYATDERGKQQFKIGKLLKNNEDLLEEFMTDPSRTPAVTLVVISRNTEDIARMAAGRSWTSCMNPKDYNFKDMGFNDIPNDIRMGTLVAYMTTENDTELNNPLARVLIKPYIRNDREEAELRKYTGEDGSGFREDHPLAAAFGRATIKVKRSIFGHTPI